MTADLVRPDRRLRPAGDGLLSALPPEGGAETPYDRWAGAYDRVVGSGLYNRVAWGNHPGDYRAFARAAVADADGPLLDAAAGTAVFTADAYREARRRIVVADLSAGMLRRARERLGAPPHAAFVQADALDPPFAPGAFATVACMGSLHVFPDPGAVVRALGPLLAPGGRLFASGLVAETRLGSRYLRLLERAGEVGPPRTAQQLVDAVAAAAGRPVTARRRGSMLYLVTAWTTPR